MTDCSNLLAAFPNIASSDCSTVANGGSITINGNYITSISLKNFGFTGSLPNFSGWTALTSVDLSNNLFTGSVGTVYTNLSPLTSVNLQYNCLTGSSVPSRTGGSFNNNLFIGGTNNPICFATTSSTTSETTTTKTTTTSFTSFTPTSTGIGSMTDDGFFTDTDMSTDFGSEFPTDMQTDLTDATDFGTDIYTSPDPGQQTEPVWTDWWVEQTPSQTQSINVTAAPQNADCLAVTKSFAQYTTDPDLMIDCGKIANTSVWQWEYAPSSLARRGATSSKNYFSGSGSTGPLPTTFAKLKNLESLDLSGNKLTTIPNIFSGMKNLANVDLTGNSAITSLPQSLVTAPKIASLAPTVYNKDCLLLKTAFANYTYITASGVKGKVKTLLNQDCFTLTNNTYVSWTIPPSQNTSSTVLTASGVASTVSALSAATSTAVASSTGKLVRRSHHLERRAPSDPQTLYRLYVLKLNNLQIAGNLPDALGKLPYLSVVDVSGNKFSGTFPSSFLNLTKLSKLNIAGNSFLGFLPNGLTGMIANNDGSLNLGTVCVAGNPAALCQKSAPYYSYFTYAKVNQGSVPVYPSLANGMKRRRIR
ncbi:L domain-like protein [Rhizoclosmatium globosum]|uniref:L domain-like protein n=1 Tax=Rhizoclosmatium globosum TaxID=329046 RepID=A0A1Y2C037_9FUNG|nr:L domain-like protein [Rhizoclosmatium globosum]|eukprot:ORY40336.1 L domain-like protein [Rhizoclosmatium globosum]